MNTAAPSAPALIELRGIGKRFGGVTALAGVDFELRAGEIHALLGENGAGKSTLIKILGGIHQPDAGDILVDGRAVRDPRGDGRRPAGHPAHSPGTLARARIFPWPKTSSSAASRDVWDFWIAVNFSPTRAALIAELGLPEIGAVETRVADLSVAQQQMVEIARALSTRARILILDEPTASLSESETEALFVKLRGLSGQGVGIIYISHRLEEIQRLADRITVLRDGRSVGTQATAALNQARVDPLDGRAGSQNALPASALETRRRRADRPELAERAGARCEL